MTNHRTSWSENQSYQAENDQLKTIEVAVREKEFEDFEQEQKSLKVVIQNLYNELQETKKEKLVAEEKLQKVNDLLTVIKADYENKILEFARRTYRFKYELAASKQVIDDQLDYIKQLKEHFHELEAVKETIENLEIKLTEQNTKLSQQNEYIYDWLVDKKVETENSNLNNSHLIKDIDNRSYRTFWIILAMFLSAFFYELWRRTGFFSFSQKKRKIRKTKASLRK